MSNRLRRIRLQTKTEDLASNGSLDPVKWCNFVTGLGN